MHERGHFEYGIQLRFLMRITFVNAMGRVGSAEGPVGPPILNENPT